MSASAGVNFSTEIALPCLPQRATPKEGPSIWRAFDREGRFALYSYFLAMRSGSFHCLAIGQTGSLHVSPSHTLNSRSVGFHQNQPLRGSSVPVTGSATETIQPVEIAAPWVISSITDCEPYQCVPLCFFHRIAAHVYICFVVVAIIAQRLQVAFFVLVSALVYRGDVIELCRRRGSALFPTLAA